MRFSVELAHKFESELENDELVIWTARPAFLATFCRVLPQLLIPPALLFALDWSLAQLMWDWLLLRLFFLMLLFLIAGGVVYTLFALFTTVYAVTNKRFRICFWFWGYQHRTIGLHEMAEIDVIANGIDQWLGVSTVRIYLGLLNIDKAKIYHRIVGIREAERVRDLMARLIRANPIVPKVPSTGS